MDLHALTYDISEQDRMPYVFLESSADEPEYYHWRCSTRTSQEPVEIDCRVIEHYNVEMHYPIQHAEYNNKCEHLKGVTRPEVPELLLIFLFVRDQRAQVIVSVLTDKFHRLDNYD